jgi:IS30 family transposase
VSGSANSRIATRVERRARFVMRANVGSRDMQAVINVFIERARRLPHEVCQSLTWSRGNEMADHKPFALATDIRVRICDPQVPPPRGSSESRNGLRRQCLPKGVAFTTKNSRRSPGGSKSARGRH